MSTETEEMNRTNKDLTSKDIEEIKWLWYYGYRGPKAITNLYKINLDTLRDILLSHTQ